MNFSSKLFWKGLNKIYFLYVVVIMSLTPLVAIAQQGTIIPAVKTETCDEILQDYMNKLDNCKNTADCKVNSEILGCGIVTGRVTLSMFPFLFSYVSNYILGLVSLISVLFVVLGGFMYAMAPYTDGKDKGKAFIRNALIGMVISFLAWSFVNAIIYLVTG